MNDAIFKFKRYEDSSLSYTGIDRHEGKEIGGWDTVIKREEYEQLFYNQQSTMESSGHTYESEDDLPMAAEEPAPYTIKPATPATAKPSLVTESFGIKKPEIPKATVVAQIEKPKEEDLDLSGVEVGTAVTHKAFGTGTVTWIDKAQKHIRVTFNAGEKTFIFPDAFKQGFLKL